MANIGLGRVFSPKHHVLPKIKDEITSMFIYEVGSKNKAHTMETKLIREFRPKYNERKFAKTVWSAGKIVRYLATQ